MTILISFKDWFGKSDPYLEIYREDSLGDKILLHKTEVIKNTLNPTWRKFSISMQSLSRGNIDTAILVRNFFNCYLQYFNLITFY